MLPALVAVVLGLILLVWSADRFIDGAAATARHFGMPSLLIGMVIIGFGTSAPEMMVSAIAATEGNPGIALGNAYGSNITNIALILGLTALLSPIIVHSRIIKLELPVLCAITALAVLQLWDGKLSRGDAWVLLGTFAGYMIWSTYEGMKHRNDILAQEAASEVDEDASAMPLGKAVFWLVIGLLLLIVASRALVWGAVEIATGLGVSDLIIGLTIVAVGTSLPELASSLMAIRKNEHDLALGNIIGSNLFNTLAVVGIAGSISPMSVAPEILHRDVLVMSALTLGLFVFTYGFRGVARISRLDGAFMLSCFIAYTGLLVWTVLAPTTATMP